MMATGWQRTKPVIRNAPDEFRDVLIQIAAVASGQPKPSREGFFDQETPCT